MTLINFQNVSPSSEEQGPKQPELLHRYCNSYIILIGALRRASLMSALSWIGLVPKRLFCFKIHPVKDLSWFDQSSSSWGWTWGTHPWTLSRVVKYWFKLWWIQHYVQLQGWWKHRLTNCPEDISHLEILVISTGFTVQLAMQQMNQLPVVLLFSERFGDLDGGKNWDIGERTHMPSVLRATSWKMRFEKRGVCRIMQVLQTNIYAILLDSMQTGKHIGNFATELRVRKTW